MDRDGTDGGRDIFERQNNRERVLSAGSVSKCLQ